MRRDGVANRERILVAAEEVFGAGGAGTSTEEVARRAEVGVATVFRHFPTKQDLVEATAMRYLQAMEDEARRLGEEAEPGPALAAVIRTLVASGPTKVTLLNMLLTEGQSLSDTVTAAVATIREEVGRVLARAQAAGAAGADVTVGDVFTLARALAHVAVPDDEATDRAMGVVLDGLGVRRT